MSRRITTAELAEPGMVKAGDVRAVRELKHGVQAQVCLGSNEHGSATVTVVAYSLEVLDLLAKLKLALAKEAGKIVQPVLGEPAA